jgi:Leucine-rich repeat (LRR) protein
MKQCLITDGVEKWGMTAPEDGEIGVDWLMAYNQATSDRVGVSDPFYKGNTLKCDGVASLSGLSDLSTSDTYRLELTNSTVEDFSQLEMIPSLRELSVQNSSMERVPDSILWLR